MTANLTMVVEQHDDVLTVPNAALRFTPAGMTQEMIAELLAANGEPAAPAANGGAPVPPVPGAEAGPRGEGRGGGNFGQGGGRGNRGGGGRGARGGGGAGRPQRGILWVEAAPGSLKPIQVRTGLTDGSRTEILSQNVQEGMEIVTSDISQTAAPAQRPAQLPFGVPNIGGGRGRGGF
jgi:HlyD family secretion protein